MTTPPRLDIAAVCVSRGGTRVLDEIDLTVEAGEIVLVQGANGSGKSTLLEAVAGLLRVERGQIRMDGASIGGLRTESLVRRGVTLVHQERHLFPALTVRQHLELAAFAAGPDEGLQNVDELLATWSLNHRCEVPAGLLSGGEQRLLALARGLRRRPRLLLLDEPLAALSPVRRELVLSETKALARQGTAVVIVEHDVERTRDICDRVLTLEAGHIARPLNAAVLP